MIYYLVSLAFCSIKTNNTYTFFVNNQLISIASHTQFNTLRHIIRLNHIIKPIKILIKLEKNIELEPPFYLINSQTTQ